MFIRKSQGGYNRHGEQFARGSFLMIFAHNEFKAAEELGIPWSEVNLDGRKLYACVRHVSLKQMGAWMMGTARIAGQSVTVSGSYGSDGLPMDYEELTPAGRQKLVEVPKDLADKYWAGGGWNSSGSEAPAMKEWALKTFRKGA
jgi:hypothetical protein